MLQKGFSKQKQLLTVLLFITCFTNLLFADAYYFFVQFTDKNNSPFSLENPAVFLSSRSIQRRNTLQIAIDSTDLPVNPAYISTINNQGVTIHSSSKWMNGVTLLTSDSTLMSNIRNLPFVKNTFYTGKKLTGEAAPLARSKKLDPDNDKVFEYDTEPAYELEYGYAAGQINQLNGAALHAIGYTGKDIHIGVLDAGFRNVDTNPAFDSLRLQNRLLGAISIIDQSINVYQEDPHGANVLSSMAGNLPGQYWGTAPHASYWLIQTEYVPTEYMVEVDFWVRGLEFADSAGVDVINSSLGYTQFDDNTMDFTYADMNGQVSRASMAAYLASRKGMIICTSAGNDGNQTWKYIGSPADAAGILTIGAVNTSNSIAAFSSYGPTADNRVKPEVCATGWGTALIDLNGNLVYGNGTSYSSPVMGGMSACYLQYCKENLQQAYSVDLIRQYIINSCDRFNSPHDQYGYGIPDFQQALQQTATNSLKEPQDIIFVDMKYYPAYGEIKINNYGQRGDTSMLLQIITPTGKVIHKQLLEDLEQRVNISHLTTGFYLVQVSYPGHSRALKIMIH